jgi:predicted dehydrogenase
MMKIGIIGLGIGSMYYKLLNPFFEVITVDIDASKNPTYSSLDECLKEHSHFDLFIVATPNFLHKNQVYSVIPIADIVLVEKPGFESVEVLESLYAKRQNVFMTKNNLWREEFPFIRQIIRNNYYGNDIKRVNISWINKSRVPFPGFWFTEKAKSWGGTSRDSFPHLLSEFYYLFYDLFAPNPFLPTSLSSDGIFNSLTFDKEVKQNFTLDQVKDTDYGTVNPNGIYDVDDYCKIDFHQLPVSIIGCWKSPTNEDTKIGIELILKDGTIKYFDFDLCPEYCYFKQFNYFLNITEEEKEEQHKIDLFIHSIIEKL